MKMSRFILDDILWQPRRKPVEDQNKRNIFRKNLNYILSLLTFLFFLQTNDAEAASIDYESECYEDSRNGIVGRWVRHLNSFSRIIIIIVHYTYIKKKQCIMPSKLKYYRKFLLLTYNLGVPFAYNGMRRSKYCVESSSI